MIWLKGKQFRYGCNILLLFVAVSLGIKIVQIIEKQLVADTTEQALTDLIFQYQSGKVNNIDLKTVTPFEWERLHVFSPYIRTSWIDKTVGKAWRETCSNRIEHDDGIVYLVFTIKDRAVQCIEYGRGNVDFSLLDINESGIPIEAAVFILDEQGNVIPAK